MKKSINIVFIIFRIFLGGFMIYGGIKVLYINGAKQTGYFWQVLGVCELLFGLLLILQGTGFIGALFLLPITLNIFLFHLFLEPDDIKELIQTSALFGINIALVLKEREKWKHFLWIKPI